MTHYSVTTTARTDKIECGTRREAQELAERLSIETRYLWYMMIVAED